MDNLVLVVAAIGVLGVGAQWIAWRFNLPAIVVMAVAGILAGPVLGILRPPPGVGEGLPPMQALLGEFYQPIIAIAVAVILFEGGLSLNFAELRGLTKGVRRLVFPGAAIAWGLGSLAAHYIAGLSWPTAILFAGVMVVTGPTVIIPLLRQARLKPRPATLLKWEGIINDPIGALLAVLVYEVIVFSAGGDDSHGASPGQIFASLLIASVLACALGFMLGRFAATVFQRGWAPEYLKPPILLVLVLVCFEIANLLQEEAGLLAVTAMGVTMANSRIASINELRLFKENIAVLLVAGVFVILTANLTVDMLTGFDLRAFAFLGAMLFVVRPLTVFLSTIGAGLPWQERLLVGWIAPRGIVAVAVSSFFGASLAAAGYEDGARLIPLAFAMVFATVLLHGFTIGPLARALGLVSSERPGVLISGASPWSAGLAAKLKEMDVPVVVADASWRRLRPVRLAEVETYYGEILSEVTEHHLDLNRFGYLLALSGNEAHNALVCTDLAPEMGRAAIYQVNARGKDEEDRRALSFTLQGRTFLHSGATLDELLRRHYAGWIYQRTRLTEEYPPEKYFEDLGDEYEIVLIQRKGALLFASQERPVKPEIGDLVLAYLPKPAETAPKRAGADEKAESVRAERPQEAARPAAASLAPDPAAGGG
ncbi:cation:proton antiporter [Amphiplicatus metriothermophilus]|uniref:Sodium/proton antiporter, CPA1 family n=1 Tax=Amphiplicatus metriothermophilus TaxID=1519374 RepID=A0A239Q051_9PROT|nr:sodium:proton antiporter [Amphiplicatus metriothermophilus]MBB5519738.1 NhaP-type Na+/H+ or K+/H+ antiporter [Amphiplicatus metriothermophilus]SNT75287.1 sodium/proton antiporter, CPA1 family [Amphiplicatus metriothermophilus]